MGSTKPASGFPLSLFPMKIPNEVILPLCRDAYYNYMPNILGLCLCVAKIHIQYKVNICVLRKGFIWKGLSLTCLSPVLIIPCKGLFLYLLELSSSMSHHFGKEKGAFVSLLSLAGRITSRWHLTLKRKQKHIPCLTCHSFNSEVLLLNSLIPVM